MFRILPNTVNIVHGFLRQCLPPGGVAVDATVGNGKDTLFLARQVGTTGRVYGFDVQEKAIAATARLLAEGGYRDNIRLFQVSHEFIDDYVTEPVDAVVFNLGYLPGGDHALVTRPESTVHAVAKSLRLLSRGGMIAIVVYTGHHGSTSEKHLLEEFLLGLSKKDYCVGKYSYINRQRSPYAIIIEKSGPSLEVKI